MSSATEPEVLQGGVANAGAVLRYGSIVERPSNAHSATIHAYLRHLRANGFEGASGPMSIDGGRERVVYVPGDVPVPPYPRWAQTDHALASLGRLQRGLHDAGAGFDAAGATWSTELDDDAPGDGSVICHNDICPENVVFRDGEAVALLDFDSAAPGRRAFDIAVLARMCVPIDDDVSAANLGWSPADRPRRLRVLADAYGLDAGGRDEVMTCLDEAIARGGEFVLRHVEAGETGFVERWNGMGGMERFDRRRRWWLDARSAFGSAVGSLLAAARSSLRLHAAPSTVEIGHDVGQPSRDRAARDRRSPERERDGIAPKILRWDGDKDAQIDEWRVRRSSIVHLASRWPLGHDLRPARL